MRLMATRMVSRRRARGFTLVEVLVALLVFSIGLIGLGASMTLAIRSNNVAGQRTQAVFLAESLMDMMRANDQGVWAALYDGDYPVGGATNCNSGCNFNELAQRDRAEWSLMLQRSLPNGRANVNCVLDAASAPSGQTRRMPDGLCTVSLTWSESVDVEGDPDGIRDQSFAWVVNP